MLPPRNEPWGDAGAGEQSPPEEVAATVFGTLVRKENHQLGWRQGGCFCLLLASLMRGCSVALQEALAPGAVCPCAGG